MCRTPTATTQYSVGEIRARNLATTLPHPETCPPLDDSGKPYTQRHRQRRSHGPSRARPTIKRNRTRDSKAKRKPGVSNQPGHPRPW